MAWILLLFQFYFASHGPGELPLPKVSYDKIKDAMLLDSLRESCGQNKVLPPGFELQALRALSHYPELRDVSVEFVLCKSKIAHTSAPVFGSLLRRKSKRRYRVTISTETPPHREAGRLPNLSYNAQIGVLGHELAHTVDYLDRGFLNMIGLGIRYTFSKKTVREWENFTDSTAIQHNLGHQLLAWSREVRHLLEADGRGENYLSPWQIEEAMRSIEAYRTP